MSEGRASAELLQEAKVVLVEETDVVDVVLEHRDPLDAHAEGEALDALGVVAVLAHVLEDVGVDLARAENLDPALALADVAAGGADVAGPGALEAGHVDLDAGLGEGE